MRDIKVFGTGSDSNTATYDLIQDVARANGIEVKLKKVRIISGIQGSDVLTTPGVVIDGNVVHAGGTPSKGEVEKWLGASECCGCCGGGD